MALINLDKHQKEHALLQLLQPEQTGANLSAELAAIGSPITLWQSGMPFVLFFGDGGSIGMLFTGTAGNFTLSAAVMTGFVIPGGYCYLPANAGGLGNVAGWYYFEMSSTTAGVVYNNQFIPTPGNVPRVPTEKLSFANPAGGRITQTTADVTVISYPLAAGEMGPNGLLRLALKLIGGTVGIVKNVKVLADSTTLHVYSPSGVSIVEYEIITQNSGTLNAQINSRRNTWVGGVAVNSLWNDFTTFNFASACTLSVTISLDANTDSVLLVPRRCVLIVGA